jgi:hypothetical protein
MRYLSALVLALSLGAGLAACDSKPKGDPAACKTSAKEADACKSCCKAAGAAGHMWAGDACTCL